MAMTHPTYPHYKPSGVEWLGDVPRHWEVIRLKKVVAYLVSNVDKVPLESEIPIQLCNYTDVYYNDFITPDMDLMETTATKEEIQKFGLRVDDVIITKDSEEWSDIAIPALVKKTAPNLVCGYHLAIVRPLKNQITGNYLLRAFQSQAINQQFQIAASGVTRYGLPKSAIGESWVPLPPLTEQHAIAEYLDRETGRIDTLMTKKRALIERLKEKRTALISRTVTRGLPPDAARAAGLPDNPPLKSSGVEWLGDVPVHWEVRPLKSIVAKPITDGPHETPEILDHGIPFVSAEAINNGKINFSKIRGYISPSLHLRYSKKYKPQLGDIFLVKSGATTGRTAIVEEDREFNIWSPLAAIRPNNKTANSCYIHYSLQSKEFQTAIELNWSYGTQQNIGMGVIQNLSLPLPPLAEQNAIAAYLDAETRKIDTLVAKIEAAIERLQEYRSALITAAVTGKIDVRGPM